MKPERWQQVEHLFHSALEQGPEERASFLGEACAGDEELRKQVEALLDGHDRAGSFIEQEAFAVAAKNLAADQAAAETDSIIGQTISHYRIIRRLGAGAMGEVYLAQDITLGRQVALKLLPASVTEDSERLRRFEQEARTASALNHPNILTIYEISRADSVRFIATEFVEGITLRERISDKGMDLDEAVEIGIQVASALAAAHAKGIVHRDIKPENIMISAAHALSYVKVLDFGIAKLTGAQTLETDVPTRPLVSTNEGMTMGTAPYMSPEQAKGMKVDARTDIWSLGVVLYEMISGRVPFEGPTRSHLIVSILEKEPQPLLTKTELPESLEWIVMKTLRKDPDDRYQTARELYNDLKELRQRLQQDVAARPLTPRDRRAERSDSAQPADSTLPSMKRPAETASSSGATSSTRTKKSSVWVIAGLVFVSVAGVALGLKIFWPSLKGRNAAIPFKNFKVDRLTTSGKASSAVISPDGKYVVHVKESGGQSSLWIKHIATGSDKEIVSADGSQIENLSFSPDGNHIYFIKKAKEITLNEITILGGPSKKLVTDIDTGATLSPDGKRFAFIRGDPTRDEASLIIANADGTSESKLITRQMRDLFGPVVGTPSWSPDGEKIAFVRNNKSAAGDYTQLVTVTVKDGVEHNLTSEKWTGIETVCWLSDGKGLLLTAMTGEHANAQIWYVSYPAGAARQITNDPNNYQNVSVTADGRSLVTVLSEGHSDVWVMANGDPGSVRQVGSNRFDGISGIAWSPDGHIVHVSRESGNADVWIMNADGSQDQPLTSNTSVNVLPCTSADGQFVVFVSNRTGSLEIWRMDLDGKNQTQLTFGANDTGPACSLDGKWVFYTSGGENRNSLWKVPINGGKPSQLTDFTALFPEISPRDGSISYTFVDQQANPARFRRGVIDANGGGSPKVFDLPPFSGTLGPAFYGQRAKWTPDGKALAYISNKDAVGNLWSQPIDGGPPKQLTKFTSDMIFNYAWSSDGKKLALARGSKTSDVVLISDLGGVRN